MDDLQSKLEQLGIQGNEKDRQNQLDLITAYNNLLDKLSDWELKYVFKAPKKGKVQFLKFWETNQFVQAGEAVFNIVPDKAVIIGQMHLPTKGVGKVKIGQDVIIKLDNYPYMEYGSITGKVSSVSLTSDFEKSASGSSVDLYLVNITLPNQLKTNYGPKLEFKFEIKGTADIVTNDRRLIQRLFDNLKYVVRQ